MRGPFRRAENRGAICNATARSEALRLAATPPHPPRGACHRAGHFGPDPLARSTSPRTRGEVDKQSRSRGGPAPSPRLRGEGRDEGASPRAKNRGAICNATARSEALRLAATPPHPPRGACHRAGHFGPDPLARTTSPRTRGEVDKQSRSRGGPAPSPRLRGEGRDEGASPRAENRGAICNATARSEALRLAATPPHPPRFARSTSPRTRGEVDKQSRSRVG